MQPDRHPPFEPTVLARTAAVVVLSLLLVALNFYTLWRVARLERALDRPVSVHCSGATVSPEALRGITNLGLTVGPELLPDGKVDARLGFMLLEKVPGSVLTARYSTSRDGPWVEIACTQPEPLVFEAPVPDDGSTEMYYQVVETVRGEIVRASHVARYRLSEIAGDPAVRLYRIAYQGSSRVKYLFDQQGFPPVTAWQIEEIRLRLTRKGKTESLTAEWDGSSTFSCDITETDLEAIEVTVRYRDGEERTVKLQPPFTAFPEPLVTR